MVLACSRSASFLMTLTRPWLFWIITRSSYDQQPLIILALVSFLAFHSSVSRNLVRSSFTYMTATSSAARSCLLSPYWDSTWSSSWLPWSSRPDSSDEACPGCVSSRKVYCWELGSSVDEDSSVFWSCWCSLILNFLRLLYTACRAPYVPNFTITDLSLSDPSRPTRCIRSMWSGIIGEVKL